MKVQCTKCQSKYNIKDEKIPDAGAKIKCPKCQNVISVMKPEPEPPALSSEELTEDIENESVKTGTQDVIEPKTKKCPYCADKINVDAIKCKHCGSDLVENKSAKMNKNTGELFGVLLLICPLLAIFLLWFIPLPFFHIIIIMSAIITTAILAAVEASQLNFGTTPSGKKETGPIGFFLGMLLLWVISYPFYFYKRSKKGKKNFVFGSILVTVVFVFSIGASGYSFDRILTTGFDSIVNPNIAMVKNGTLQKYPQKTVGKAIEGFMGNPQWEAITGTDGNSYVNVKGKILYDGKEATAALQFRIYKERDTFEINAFEINGKPANMFELWGLLENMYASS